MRALRPAEGYSAFGLTVDLDLLPLMEYKLFASSGK